MSYGLYVENSDSRIQIDSENYINQAYYNSGSLSASSSWPPSTWTKSNSTLFFRSPVPGSFPTTYYVTGASYSTTGSYPTTVTCYSDSPDGPVWPAPSTYSYKQYRNFSALTATNTGYGLQVWNNTPSLVYDSNYAAQSANIVATGIMGSGQNLIGTFTDLNKIWVDVSSVYHYHETIIIAIPPSGSASIKFRIFNGFKYVWTSSTAGSLYTVSETININSGNPPTAGSGGFRYTILRETP